MIIAAKILSGLSDITEFVGSDSYADRELNPPIPSERYVHVEQAEHLLFKMLGKVDLARKHIEKLENSHVELLTSKEIDELEFARHSEITTAIRLR